MSQELPLPLPVMQFSLDKQWTLATRKQGGMNPALSLSQVSFYLPSICLLKLIISSSVPAERQQELWKERSSDTRIQELWLSLLYSLWIQYKTAYQQEHQTQKSSFKKGIGNISSYYITTLTGWRYFHSPSIADDRIIFGCFPFGTKNVGLRREEHTVKAKD